ncbi:MAG: methyltransferase [Fibrobacteres bacterium]|nr:methyltransferase [Fibrobacterota bacterium]
MTSASIPTCLPSDALLARFAPAAPVPGRPDLIAWQARDVFDLWKAWEEESGVKQDIPYWATAWPAARLTAAYLGKHPETAAGKVVLDFGCGGGVAALAAAKAGATRVIANDIDTAALAMAERNAALNGLTLDIEDGNLLTRPPNPEWNVILVADLFYEKSVAGPMLDWLRRALSQGSRVLIADACRPFAPQAGVRLLAEETYATDVDLEGSEARKVRLLELLP